MHGVTMKFNFKCIYLLRWQLKISLPVVVWDTLSFCEAGTIKCKCWQNN